MLAWGVAAQPDEGPGPRRFRQVAASQNHPSALEPPRRKLRERFGWHARGGAALQCVSNNWAGPVHSRTWYIFGFKYLINIK